MRGTDGMHQSVGHALGDGARSVGSNSRFMVVRLLGVHIDEKLAWEQPSPMRRGGEWSEDIICGSVMRCRGLRRRHL